MLTQADRAFLVAIEPPLLARQMAVVIARLRANWPPERLLGMTESSVESVAALAARCLGFVGTAAHARRLAELLKHPHENVAEAAEDALWNIGMRAYTGRLHDSLQAAVERIGAGDFDDALRRLEELIAKEPHKAEAWHQRGLAFHSLQRYDEAEAAYAAALERNPLHFAAAAGLGHIHVERGEFSAALDFYKQALEIHPRMKELRELVPKLEAALHHRDVA